MAAPFKIGLDSFHFDVNFFSDERIEALSGEFGVYGELVAVKLLCSIYRNGYYLEWSDIQRMIFVKSLNGIELSTLDSIVIQMIEYGFFDKKMFEEFCVLTSVEIQENYLSATRRRKNIRLDYSLVNVNINSINDDINLVNVSINAINVCNNPVNVDINPSEVILPESGASNEELAQKANNTAIDVIDSSNTLELFNNPNASNNYIYQEKEKCKKEKEVCQFALPYCSNEFVATWEILRKQPKWIKKTHSALQMSLNKLAKYPEEFAIVLMENAIAGNYQGVVFTWTPKNFREWLQQKEGSHIGGSYKKPKDIYESNMESMNEAFRLIDEKYGTRDSNNKG